MNGKWRGEGVWVSGWVGIWMELGVVGVGLLLLYVLM